MKSNDLIKALKRCGWYEVNTRGSHHYFKHDNKKNKITVPHPKKDLPIGTVRSILKQANLPFLEACC